MLTQKEFKKIIDQIKDYSFYPKAYGESKIFDHYLDTFIDEIESILQQHTEACNSEEK